MPATHALIPPDHRAAALIHTSHTHGAVHVSQAATLGDVGSLITGIATLGLVAAAIGAGVIAWRQLGGLKDQLSLQRQTERRRRVFDLLEHLFDLDFIKMSEEAHKLFRHSPPNVDGWKYLWHQRDSDQQAKITAVMNFYDQVASEYNDPKGDIIDRALADKGLIIVASDMWLQAKGFVEYLRTLSTEPDADLSYKEWETMYTTFHNTH